MKGLVLFPLTVMFLIAVFGMIGISSGIGGGIGVGVGNMTYNGSILANGSAVINGSQTTVNTGKESVAFSIDPVGGFIIMITIVLGVGIAAGIRAVGSGLADTTIELITKATFFLGLWGVLSGFGYSVLSSLPLFGAYIYLMLTLSYVVGFVMMLKGGGGD